MSCCSLMLQSGVLQEFVADELLEPLYLEFVNRVNEVGVDVNRCLTHSHTASLIQFVCGLGPRKGYHLLKVIYRVAQKSDTPFNYVNIMPSLLQTPDLYCSNNYNICY